jgi:hypothetical protein
MPRYLIEVPHEAERIACYKVVRVFLTTGSHFLTHCDWGCRDGVHKAWINVEAANRDEALQVVPPAFRKDATVVELGKCTIEEVEDALSQHAP